MHLSKFSAYGLFENRTRLFAFNTATNLFTHFATIIVAIFTLPLKLEYFGINIFGIFILVSSVLTYLNKIDFGVGSTLQRYTASLLIQQKFDEIRKLLSFGILFNLVYGLLIAFVLMVVGSFADILFSLTNKDQILFKQLLFLIAIRTTINLPLSVFNTFLTGAQFYFFTNFIKLLYLFGDLAAILATINYQSTILAYVFWISIIGVFTKCIVAIFSLIKFPFTIPTLFRFHEIKGYFSFSIQMLKSQISSIIQYESDRILIGIFLTTQWLTFYHVGERLHGIIRHIFNNFVVSMTPLLAEKYASNERTYIERAIYDGTRIISFIWYPIIITLMFNSKNILKIWLGEEYEFLYLFASLFLAPYIINLPSVVMNRVLIGSGKIKEYMNIRLIGAISNLLISIILINKYGIWGVLIGTLCQSTLFGLYIYRIYFEYLSIDLSKFSYSVIGPSLIIIVITAASSILLQYLYIPANVLELFFIVIMPVLIGYCFLAIYKFNDLAFIKRVIFTS